MESNGMSTLLFTSIVFRHGDRTPMFSYPSDPHADNDYEPHGKGELTPRGKIRAYILGKNIAERYGNFIGETYNPAAIEFHATVVNRTHVSLENVIAGIYSKQRGFTPPTDYITNQFHVENYEMPDLQNDRDCAGFFKYISNHAHWEIKKSYQILMLYDTLTVQKEIDLEIPAWADKILVQMGEVAKKGRQELSKRSFTKALGRLTDKIISDMEARVEKADSSPELKMVLYSGHDINVMSLLSAMNAYNGDVIDYCASVAFELHEIGGVPGVKVVFTKDTEAVPVPIKIPGSAEFCPLDEFKRFFRPYSHEPQGE